MQNVPLLDELALIAALAVAVTVLLSRFKLPTVAGLLAAGALLGPYGFALVRELHAIEVLAEIGVVFLLFTIGLEFSLSRLRHIFRQVALGGFLQVGLTIAATTVIAMFFGQPLRRGVFYGFVFALSSTAIVLRALGERRELDAPHGRFIVGTLIFQDLCVVPMVLITPMLAGRGSVGPAALGITIALAKACAMVGATLVIARIVVPRVLVLVDASRSREVFLLAILALCIGTAWLTSLAGLSLALGAFLGGMVVADTEFGHRAMGDILPLRDAFVSIFFISLGMLFDPRVLFESPVLVLGLLAGFLLAKGTLATLSAMAMRFPSRVAWLAGVGLAQFSEFGFVLARLGQSHGVVDAAAVRPLFAAGIFSMFLTPLFVRAAPHMRAGERLLAPLERLIGVREHNSSDEPTESLSDHVVIVGYGLAGRLVAESLSSCGIPFVALELNADTVRRARADGLPVYYGDATSEETLGHAHLSTAKLLVVLMNDPTAATRVIDTARRVAPDVSVFIRTRYLFERDALMHSGASDVVAEEVEGAAEMLARVLRKMHQPRNVIDHHIEALRTATLASDRKPTTPRPRLRDLADLDELKIESALVEAHSLADGASLSSLALRSRTGTLAVGLKRNGAVIDDIDPTLSFSPGDVVYLVGTNEHNRRAIELFTAPRENRPQHSDTEHT